MVISSGGPIPTAALRSPDLIGVWKYWAVAAAHAARAARRRRPERLRRGRRAPSDRPAGRARRAGRGPRTVRPADGTAAQGSGVSGGRDTTNGAQSRRLDRQEMNGDNGK